MKCPFCQTSNSQVKDSRLSGDGACIRRRRLCLHCEGRFTTLEKVKIKELLVIKSDGSLQIFDRNKIAHSLLLATRKRPIHERQIDSLINSIVTKVEEYGDEKIYSKEIGRVIMEKLLAVDKIAYIRFVSVYMNFEDTEDFLRLAQDLRSFSK